MKTHPVRSGDFLGVVLGHVARRTGSATVLGPVWRQVVGPALDRVSAPVRWAGTALVIGCASRGWADELRARPELLQRLNARLGGSPIEALTYEAQ